VQFWVMGGSTLVKPLYVRNLNSFTCVSIIRVYSKRPGKASEHSKPKAEHHLAVHKIFRQFNEVVGLFSHQYSAARKALFQHQFLRVQEVFTQSPIGGVKLIAHALTCYGVTHMQEAVYQDAYQKNTSTPSALIHSTFSHSEPIASKLSALKWITCFPLALTLLVSLLLPVSSYAQEIKFIKYKNYLIPIEVLPEVAPPTPTGFNGTSESSNSVTLNWDTAPGAHYYLADWYNETLQGWQTSYNGWSTTHVATGLLLGSNKFRVIACRNTLCSAPTSTLIVTVLPDGSVTYSTEPSEFADPDDPIETQIGISYAAACLEVGTSVENCDADDLDSDGDGIADVSDSYPYQHDSQCLP